MLKSVGLTSMTDYSPYGNILQRYAFQGRRTRFMMTYYSLSRAVGKRDSSTLLDYRFARFSDAEVGGFLSIDPLAIKYPGWSPYSYVLCNPINLIDPDGKEVIAPNAASRQLVLQSMSYMFGKNHGFSFDGNRLVHRGGSPEGLSGGQQLMFKYFNETLVNSKTITTVRANQSIGAMEAGGPSPFLVSVGSAGATTFGLSSFVKMIGGTKIGIGFPAQNLILVPSDLVDNGINLMTGGGSRHFGAEHATAHEFGHAIINTIMKEFGGKFNGIDFNELTEAERSDWSIRFTNTLLKPGERETGEGQHDRDINTRPEHTLDPIDK